MSDNSSETIKSWLRTTSGVVFVLLVVQFVTGVLLAFYYVPSVDHAHTTVAFIEKVLSSGTWVRSLHHYGSQWLALFAFLHVIRLLCFQAYKDRRTSWTISVLLLTLVMAGGATGYSLPWDARAFFSTRIAEGLLGGLPLVGRNARLWLLAGSDISTLTLSRFFALHVLVIPFLILAVVGWKLSRQRNASLNRNAIVGGVVFLALAIWAIKHPAPLGPAVTEIPSEYLPRPGAQFLWLYQTLKYMPGGLGSIVGVVVPGLFVLVLLMLPWLRVGVLRKFTNEPQRLLGAVVVGVLSVWIVTMTTAAYWSDYANPKTRAQLARQENQEAVFRLRPFEPASIQLTQTGASTDSSSTAGAPTAYVKWCANCHGPHGEGAQQGTVKFPGLIGVSSKPRRTVNDIVSLLNDPEAFGIHPPMRSFATKLSEQEMREIAEWIVKLK